MNQQYEGIPCDWECINTDLVKNYPNETLLEQAKYCSVFSGWGILAEICKRLASKTQQRRRHSFLESFLNVGIGFGVSFLGNAFILPFYGLPFQFTPFLEIGLWFTLLSVVRSYYVRRLFVYLHDKKVLK